MKRCRACLTVNSNRRLKCQACGKRLGPAVKERMTWDGPKVTTKSCERCGTMFQKSPHYSWAQFAARKVCSRTCGGLRRAELRRAELAELEKPCVWCGTKFGRPKGRSFKQWEAAETCGRDCSQLLRASRRAATRRRKALAVVEQLSLPKTKRESVDPDGKRRCPKCSIRKPLEEFPLKGRHRHGDKRYGYCKPCTSAYTKIKKIKLLYGLDPDEAQALLDFQGGVCAICGRPPKKNALAIDHDHATGMVRGRLCWSCNRVLGLFIDKPDRFRRAADYLERPPAVEALGREVYGRKGKTTNKAPKRRRRAA